jgi:hypothetical protein
MKVMASRSGGDKSGAVSAASRFQITRDPGSLDFEKLLSDLSAAFVRVPVAEIDLEIERWLEQIVLAMDVDRSTVVQVDPTDGGL